MSGNFRERKCVGILERENVLNSTKRWSSENFRERKKCMFEKYEYKIIAN